MKNLENNVDVVKKICDKARQQLEKGRTNRAFLYFHLIEELACHGRTLKVAQLAKSLGVKVIVDKESETCIAHKQCEHPFEHIQFVGKYKTPRCSKCNSFISKKIIEKNLKKLYPIVKKAILV